MAFENGEEVVSYIGPLIDRYRRDPLIFTKALQLIPVFMARPDWPHCIEDLDKAAEQILGQRLTSIIFGFTERYLNSKEMIWPDDEPEGFRGALRAFDLAVRPILTQYWHARTDPFRIASVVCSWIGGDKVMVRFIRADGASLEVSMDRWDMETVGETLRQSLPRGDEHGAEGIEES